MWMQMVLFTLLFPVLPYVLWKCYNKEKKPERGEAVLRYVIYALLITFLSAIVLAVFSDDGTSFWKKINESAEFVLKYAVMELGAALFVAFAEWSFLKKRVRVCIDWEQFETWKPAVFCKKHIFPFLPYLLAVLVVCLNASLMFDNVVWGDEAFSANTAEASMAGILQVMYFWDNHPPLYYYWLKLFGALFGYTIPVYHLASLVPFAAGILLAVLYFRKKYGNVPAVFFIVISGLGASCIEYNLEIRMYALAFFCVIACFACSSRVIATDSKRAWIGMVLWGLAGAYSHYYALVTTGLILFFTGVAVWIRQRGKSWLKGAGAVLAYILGYSPWLFFLFIAIRNVSQSWWVSEILSLDTSLTMVMGGRGMAEIVGPLLGVLSVFLILSDSGVLCLEKQKEEISLEVHTPGLKNWKDETFSIAIGLLTIAGTVTFAYFLCFVMTPVLVDRYLYPVSGVALYLLVICCSRGMDLWKQLGEKVGLPHLKVMGKGVLVFLICILFVTGIGNFKRYRATAQEQNEMTAKTLAIIRNPGQDVKMVTNGVKHLGWTVLRHYYGDNEVVNGDYNSAEADRFWYFNPNELDQDTLRELEQSGISVTAYGQNQISEYTFYLYYFEKKSIVKWPSNA